jgi:hypothetical protein
MGPASRDENDATDESAMVVFSGAGLSAAPPASLPLGYALRDAVLGVMFDQAEQFAPDLVTKDQLAQLSVPARKLEQVLGRLWRVTGSDALECLRCLLVAVPNHAHILAALHLARGGAHATVNLDRGIEVAFGLIAGTSEVPDGWSAEYGDALVACRSVAGDSLKGLRVVASRAEFDAWVDAGEPPALLKVHGSLPAGAGNLVDVVVEDTEELGGLAPGRLAAINHLGDASMVLVTGYGGLDPDVYRPLLRAARRTHTVWATRSIDAQSQLGTELSGAGIDIRVGDPAGLATTALSDMLGVAITWPVGRPGLEPTWQDRFALWRSRFQSQHPPVQFAVAWAWLLADSGDRDRAIALLDRLASNTADPGTTVRLGDALYDRAEGNDRRRARQLYWSVSRNRTAEWGLRGHCLLRIGGIARGLAVREGGWGRVPNAFIALAMPLAVLVEQRRRGRHKDPELDPAAKAALGQTILRGCEGILPSCPPSALPVIAAALRLAAATCADAGRTTTNGNRRALAASHRLLAQSLASLVTGDLPDPMWTEELEDLADTYMNAGDLAGAGNCHSTLAVVAGAANDWPLAESHLNRARTFYAEGRPEHRLIPSGAALLHRLERLFYLIQQPDRRH